MSCPCRYCVPPKRHEACHDTCPDYIAWRAPRLAEYERKKIAVLRDDYSPGHVRAIRELHKQRSRR